MYINMAATDERIKEAIAMGEEEVEEQRVVVVIVGGGIAGLATAVALQRFGVRSLVLERSHELRSTGAALTLFPNAWRALDALGVAHRLTPLYREFLTGSFTNLENGAKMATNFSKNRAAAGGGTGARAVHRKMLLEALAEELRPATIRFSSKLASIKISEEDPKDSSTLTLHLEDGAVIKTKVLIGCDGVQSVVAQWLGLAAPIDSGRAGIRGLSVYKEGHGLENEPQQFLSTGRRAGIVPLNDYEVYWFIAHNATQREREMARDFFADPSLIQKEVEENLAKGFPEAYLDVVRHADLSSLTWAPLMLRAPWNVVAGPMQRGGVTVAGDAMHPMTPDLGQGGCSALEDAVVLARSIGPALSAGGGGEQYCAKEVEEGMKKYVGERKWRVAGLVAGSYISGWVQQGGSGLWGWFVEWFRDHVFYRFLFTRIASAVNYDCGDLPKLE